MRKAVATAPHAILFDFDGTLVDSAPDLAGAMNDLRAELNLPELPYETLRPYATYGARSLLKAGIDMSPDHHEYDDHRLRFLAIYDERKLRKTHLFNGVLELISPMGPPRINTVDCAGATQHPMGHRHQQAFALRRADDL